MDSAAPTDDAVLAVVRRMCLRFPEAEESVLQDRPLFVVRARRFALFNGRNAPDRPRWDGSGQSVHLLTDPDERDALNGDDRFRPSPHHGDRGWVAIDPATVGETELAELLEAAYRTAAPIALVARLREQPPTR